MPYDRAYYGAKNTSSFQRSIQIVYKTGHSYDKTTFLSMGFRRPPFRWIHEHEQNHLREHAIRQNWLNERSQDQDIMLTAFHHCSPPRRLHSGADRIRPEVSRTAVELFLAVNPASNRDPVSCEVASRTGVGY
ncbi:hypothetical protein TNCV_4678671 [Trichonephila clavipes]|nr:hypothetical protein TNCV_4678671 [Trichonephila clavipes]